MERIHKQAQMAVRCDSRRNLTEWRPQRAMKAESGVGGRDKWRREESHDDTGKLVNKAFANQKYDVWQPVRQTE